MPIPPNTRLGRYEIRSLLGEGGMGEVYLAEDTTLRRLVAIKLLPAEFTADRDRLHRFEREAFAASSLNHPNILTIHEFGAENGNHFIATEFIDGESLRQRLKDGRLELHEVLDLGVQGASALSAAHAARIVHRDIKPENIMVRKDGIVKVLDFGLAKLAEPEQKSATNPEAPTQAMHTAPGAMMGTVSYMSPEQARGKDIDERTDIWSLGVVLYEMIAGRRPFEGETMADMIGLILHKDPPPLTHLGTHVPAELNRIVTKALKKDKEERYQVVKDLGLDLKSLKRRLEFEAELERSGTSDRNSQAQSAAPASVSDAGTVETSQIAARAPGQAQGGSIHTTSSAEYLVEQVKRHKRGASLMLVVLVLTIAGGSYLYWGSKASINSVAVLPFVNVSNDPNTEFLSDGISESLINNLSQLPQLKVIARSSAFKYKGKEIDPDEVAKTLGVGAIVTGRIIQRGDELQVSVELINAQDKTQMWGEQYSRRATALQLVQAEIARIVSEKLRLRLTGTQEQQLAKQATANPQAYELLLKGNFYANKGGTENQKTAAQYYEQAIAVDSTYAQAYANLSIRYNNLVTNSILDPKEFTPKAEAAALKALELDESLADAHWALANLKFNAWDWKTAEREFQRALELKPNNPGTGYANYLSTMGRHDQALAEIRRVRERAPVSLAVSATVGQILFYARRYDDAIEALKKTLELDRNYDGAYLFLGYVYAAKGMYAEAIAAYLQTIKLGDESSSTQISLGEAYAKAGETEKARSILKSLQNSEEYTSPGELAGLYAALGEREQAFALLEKAYAAHDLQLQFLGVEPVYDPLRSDRRLTDLIRRVGLPQ